MTDRMAAEVFPPGEFIREELEARGWTQSDLAEILDRPPRLVSEVISGKRSITPETAKGLGDAFGTGAQFWMNLETAYQLWRNRTQDSSVARRARLYQMAPVKEMVRRQWIEHTDNIDVLEKRVADFFEITSVDEEPEPLPYAARRSKEYSRAQCAWLFRARHLAKAVAAARFTEARFREGLAKLRKLLLSPEEVRHVPRVLSESGIRFLIVEPLPQTRIDGACFWLDETSPVIVLSLRYDRIDWFWHTLGHELGHVMHRHGLTRDVVYDPLDVDLVGDDSQPVSEKPESEKQADTFAVEFLIPRSELQNFAGRVRPLYSELKIRGFAARLGIHPGIVVGQLQYLKEISYAHSRKMLVKVRQFITESALTDGWGHFPPVHA